MRSGWTPDDIERLARAAIEAGLASPDRRPLLLGRLDPTLRAALDTHRRPDDQLRADLIALARHSERRLLDGWLIEARQLALATHPVEAHLFDRYRRHRHALLVGGGKPATTRVKSALITADRLVRQGIGPAHVVDHAARYDTIEAGLTLDLIEQYTEGPPVELLWVHLAGELFIKRGTVRLRMADREGLVLTELAALLTAANAESTVVIIDTDAADEATRAAAMALDWGQPTLIVVGPAATDALVDTISAAAGRTGRQLADAMPDAMGCDGRDVIISARADGAVDVASDPHQGATIEYLEGLRTICRGVPFRRRATGLECLGDVYVPLHTDSPVDAPREPARSRLPEAEERPPKTLHDRVAEHRHLFIVGEPGSGKTTTLRQLCEMLCAAHLDPDGTAPPSWVPARPLPVWLNLRDVPDAVPCEPAALLSWGFDRLARKGCADNLDATVARDALRDGRLVLILDGLDEVADPGRRLKWAAAIADLARVQGAGARVWASCREAARAAGAEPGEPLIRVDLRPFDDNQRAEVIRRWLGARIPDADKAAAESAALIADLGRHERVDNETSSPLLLALVCLLYFDKRSLPDSRVELYSDLVDLLLRDRDREGDGRVDRLKVHQRRAVLTDLAVEWWRRVGSRGDERREQMAPAGIAYDECAVIVDDGLALNRGLAADPAGRYALAEALVDFFDLRAGLLRWTASDAGGQKQLGFAHRTFAEYLVACRVAEDARARSTELTESRARDPNWREVFTLFVAQTVQPEGADPTHAWQWIVRLGAWARDASKPASHRAAYARLAAECLEPCRDHAPPDAVIDAVDGFQDVLLDAKACLDFPVVHRAAYWHAIGEANRLVCGEDVDRWVYVPGGRYWRGAALSDEMAEEEKSSRLVTLGPYYIHRWPVLVREFARFVDGGGYAVSGWWSSGGWRWRQAEEVDSPNGWPVQRRGQPTHPVTGVSFFEAMAYARWLAHAEVGPSGVEGPPSLPTEDQWERAARGDGAGSSERRYPWGVDDDPRRRNGGGSGLRGTSPVGTFPGGVSSHGCWDMSGNAWEWCLGRLHAGPALDDAAGRPTLQRGDWRSVQSGLRGGGCGNHPQFLRVSYRDTARGGWRLGSRGFRCVWRAPPGP